MKKIINVMLVDDHNLVRAGIREMISKEPDINIIAEISSGENAVKKAKELKPDVVLMDIEMPGMSGLEATRRLLRVSPNSKVLVVTVCTGLISTRLLQAGATGYLTKGAQPDEMLQAIRSVNQGKRYISPDIAQKIALSHLDNREQSPFDDLSDREWEIMELIVRGEQAKEVSEKLFLSPKTVNSYRYRIFAKTGAKNDVELTLLAVKHGIVKQEQTHLDEK